jgi:S-adenosylmethionine:tRNA ribosyltransferase-isomerase
MPMRTDDFDYVLPEKLVAQFPSDKRGESRMLVLNSKTGEIDIKLFSDLPSYLRPTDAIVFNNTKVMYARMYGVKEHTGAKIEVLITTPLDDEKLTWKAMLKPGKRAKVGSKIFLINRDGEETLNFFEVLEHNEDGTFVVKFSSDIWELQKECGHIPLPPYIKRGDKVDDFERYQTVFAQNPGAVAAPTAGLHFTETIISQIKNNGISVNEVTLHVGPGTFKPVSVDNVEEHKMHSEQYFLSEETTQELNEIKKNSGRILAVGTTSVRVLESCADADSLLVAGEGETDIFIYPPYKPKFVDILLTNFHLPKSTLLMLVSSFAGKDNIMNAYQRAIEEEFMFYSYGDCMLII